MALDFVVQAFQSVGGVTTIQRFFIDMPIPTDKICLIRQVQVQLVELIRPITNFDVFYAMSVDPDHVLSSMILMDSTIFLSGVWELLNFTGVGFVLGNGIPWTFYYPEGIRCPYTRLPFFIQHSNNSVASPNWHVKVFFEFVKKTPQELAVAVMRRGRGVTRRVP